MHVKTFEEIPIFGGSEYRKRVLKEQQKVPLFEMVKQSQYDLTKMTKNVGCSIAQVVSSTANSLLRDTKFSFSLPSMCETEQE